MDAPGSSSKNVKEGESSSIGETENSFLPGFPTLEDYSKVNINFVVLHKYGGVCTDFNVLRKGDHKEEVEVKAYCHNHIKHV